MEFDPRVLNQLASAQNVPLSTVVDAVTDALTDAYARTKDAVPNAAADLDLKAGKIRVTAPDGTDVTPTDFGRLAAATARQAVTQWLRDVERIRKVGSWAGREGTLVTGTVRAHAARNKRGETLLDLGGGLEAVMPSGEATPGEVYNHGDQLTALVLAVNVDDRDRLKITISRRQPTLVSALFAKVSPEVASNRVRVVAIARDPGSRTKIAVTTDVAGLNPAAALIGTSADRIRRVAADLAGEKLDVVVYDADLATFVAAALTPARVAQAEVVDEVRRCVEARVDYQQLPLAVGKDGANARLAARLTGARIDVRAL